jgi:hypothetical protein
MKFFLSSGVAKAAPDFFRFRKKENMDSRSPASGVRRE